MADLIVNAGDPGNLFVNAGDPGNLFVCAGDPGTVLERPLFPARPGNRVTPLIEAADMYPALERRVLAATGQVWLAFRIFDPDTATRSAEARALGLGDWTALIRHVIEAGVTVRLLLADFEPIMADHLHGGSWSTFRTLRAMSATLPEAMQERLQIIVIQHEGELGFGTRQLLRIVVGVQIARLLRRMGAEADNPAELLSVRPGLWRHHRLDARGRPRFRLGHAPRLWPATYHQKFAVIDGRTAIVGGLDVDERRYDDKRHRQRADRTWHDLSVAVEGPAVVDAAAHFRDCWNAELPRFRAIAEHWTSGTDRALALDPLASIDALPPVPEAVGEATVQAVRTVSSRDHRLFAVGPRPQVMEIADAHWRLIGAAERSLYIEAQFFRYKDAARWIVARARARPELEVIVVLPSAPEEVAYDGDRRTPHRHGEWLQMRNLEVLTKALGDRVGLFMLARPTAATEAEKEFVADRGTVFGAGTIYLHAKLPPRQVADR
ncbi:hypothetical protein KX816_16480 [Sphingosinicellaceae bacterium]|nr:hypothetical protein KX816_16480 [Sphingosinicellaceae bacterium]